MELESVKKLLERQATTGDDENDNNNSVSSSSIDDFSEERIFDALTLEGIQIDLIEPGRVLASMKIPSRLLNSGNSLHGGATASIVDMAGTAAIYSVGRPTTGISLEINVSYLDSAILNEEIEIEAKVLRAGKEVGVVSVEFRKKKTGKLIAQGRHTKYLAESRPQCGVSRQRRGTTPQGYTPSNQGAIPQESNMGCRAAPQESTVPRIMSWGNHIPCGAAGAVLQGGDNNGWEAASHVNTTGGQGTMLHVNNNGWWRAPVVNIGRVSSHERGNGGRSFGQSGRGFHGEDSGHGGRRASGNRQSRFGSTGSGRVAVNGKINANICIHHDRAGPK